MVSNSCGEEVMMRLLSILIMTLIVEAFISHYQVTCITQNFIPPDGMPVPNGQQMVCFLERIKQ